jgi:hypothetical protein
MFDSPFSPEYRLNPITKKAFKSVLLHKLEGFVDHVQNFPNGYVLIVDIVTAGRHIKIVKLTYKDFAKVGKSAIIIVVVYVYGIYLESSIKDIERNRRSHGVITSYKRKNNLTYRIYCYRVEISR